MAVLHIDGAVMASVARVPLRRVAGIGVGLAVLLRRAVAAAAHGQRRGRDREQPDGGQDGCGCGPSHEWDTSSGRAKAQTPFKFEIGFRAPPVPSLNWTSLSDVPAPMTKGPAPIAAPDEMGAPSAKAQTTRPLPAP